MPALGDSDAEELRDLKQERMALTSLVASISERDTLQFLTDEGLLPNYAFPEQGVLLHSVIIRDDKRVGPDPEDRVLTFEYERPGASAITELAPNNAFYAEGRKVTIEQVDISRDKPALAVLPQLLVRGAGLDRAGNGPLPAVQRHDVVRRGTRADHAAPLQGVCPDARQPEPDR